MRTIAKTLMGVLLATTALAATGAGAGPTATKTGGVKPVAEPGWVVVEEDWFYPLRMESVDALNNARYFYRRDNERAAADEIRKAASWLTYASGHALDHTKQALMSARTDLLTVADDLSTGKITDAARLDKALAGASSALAEWHYYRAREEFGKQESADAARDLEAAAAHLENAAFSAHMQYGPDTITVFDHVYRDGKLVSQGKTIDNDMVGKNLDGIETAVNTMARSLSAS